MTISDIVVLAIIAVAMLLGFWKGIMRTILRFAEIIVTVGLGGLGVMITMWTGLVDFDSVQSGNIDFATLIIPIAVFLVVFVVTMIVCDFLINKYIYRKGHFKKKLADHLIGMFVAMILTIVMLYALVAFIGTFAPNYVDLVKLFDSGKILPLIYDYNPFSKLMDKIVTDNGIKKVIMKILDMFWPTFEYLG